MANERNGNLYPGNQPAPETKEQYLKRTTNQMTHDLVDYLQKGQAHEAGTVMAQLFMEYIPNDHVSFDDLTMEFGGSFDEEVGS